MALVRRGGLASHCGEFAFRAAGQALMRAALWLLALFGVAPTYMPQIDRHLGELLATPG